MVHSGAARAGIENMTATLCSEWIESDVRINCVRPGIIWTERWEWVIFILIMLLDRRASYNCYSHCSWIHVIAVILVNDWKPLWLTYWRLIHNFAEHSQIHDNLDNHSGFANYGDMGDEFLSKVLVAQAGKWSFQRNIEHQLEYNIFYMCVPFFKMWSIHITFQYVLISKTTRVIRRNQLCCNLVVERGRKLCNWSYSLCWWRKFVPIPTAHWNWEQCTSSASVWYHAKEGNAMKTHRVWGLPVGVLW